jgi:hypothetical protein
MANLIRLKQIESGSNLTAAAGQGAEFSSSVINVVTGEIGVLLDGATLNNVIIGTTDSDKYSLIVSGAVAIVNANNLTDGGLNDIDTNVPGQLWLNGQSLPTDPSISGSAVSNIIDQGEW